MPQKIVTPGGEELVLLSRAEYDRLSALASEAEEDAADVAAYDAAMADLSGGSDSILPPEVSASLMKGASLIAAFRIWRGVGETELAARAGISQQRLLDLEGGRSQGSEEELEVLAKALEIPAHWLI